MRESDFRSAEKEQIRVAIISDTYMKSCQILFNINHKNTFQMNKDTYKNKTTRKEFRMYLNLSSKKSLNMMYK